jgi:N-acetylneuraminate synthase
MLKTIFLSHGSEDRELVAVLKDCIEEAFKDGQSHLLIAHSTSTYPCPLEELNLRMIRTLRARYPAVRIRNPSSTS